MSILVPTEYSNGQGQDSKDADQSRRRPQPAPRLRSSIDLKHKSPWDSRYNHMRSLGGLRFYWVNNQYTIKAAKTTFVFVILQLYFDERDHKRPLMMSAYNIADIFRRILIKHTQPIFSEVAAEQCTGNVRAWMRPVRSRGRGRGAPQVRPRARPPSALFSGP